MATMERVVSEYRSPINLAQSAPLAQRPQLPFVLSKESLMVKRAPATIPQGVSLKEMVRVAGQGMTGSGMPYSVLELLTTGDFPSAWNKRIAFNIDAGRDEEPILYEPLFNIVSDPSLPENVEVNRLGPGGVVFHKVVEGGEVKFVSMNSSTQTIKIEQYATGLMYTKQLVEFNRFWEISQIERQAGIAYNALLNHIHLSPFLTATYGAANQTAASTSGTTLVEKVYNTLEKAMADATKDKKNPRRGPYYILCSLTNAADIEKAVEGVPQEGFSRQSRSTLSRIRGVIAYDGWTGRRNNDETTYSGVADNKCYLISTQYAETDHQSWVKQPLMMEEGSADVSRFIRAQMVWDTFFGVYVNPTASAQEVTLPT